VEIFFAIAYPFGGEIAPCIYGLVVGNSGRGLHEMSNLMNIDGLLVQ